MREFRTEIQWTVVILALLGLAVYALWPRESGTEPQAASPSNAAPVRPEQRAAAELRPCPQDPAPGPDGLAGVPDGFAGVSATCAGDGTPVDVGAAVAGKPTLINIWATWCAPCRKELPALQAYSERPGAPRVLGVQVQSPEADGLDLLRELGVHFPVVHDRENQVQRALRAPNTMPMSYLVTGDGDVHPLDPVVFESPQEVEQAVHRALGGHR